MPRPLRLPARALALTLPVVCLLAIHLALPRAAAASAITVTASAVQVTFPVSVSFSLSATGSAPITTVSLQINTPQKTYGAVPLDVQPTFTSGLSVNAAWTWQNPGPGATIPPGVDISYRWTLKDANGDTLQTPLQTARYEDTRFSWQRAEAPGIALYWYDGGADFGHQLARTATDGLHALAQQQGVDLKSPVQVYIYSTQRALRSAMIGSPVWIGGRSYPEYNTILLIVQGNDLEAGRKALVHELTHQLVYQQTVNPLIGSQLPLWLNEGLAVTAEGPTSSVFSAALKRAVAANSLPSLRALDSQFPADPRASDLAYAESESMVRYLLARGGPDSMRQLLGVFQAGSRIDPALQTVYGLDLNSLQDAWRASIGARPLGSPVGPSSGSAPASRRQSVPAGAISVAAGFGILSLLLILATALLIHVRLRRRSA